MKYKYILIIYLIINIIAFSLYGIDKYKAVHKKWRIPEKALLLWGLFGAQGQIMGMYFFHHKTKKWYFVTSALLSLALHIFILYKLLLYSKFL